MNLSKFGFVRVSSAAPEMKVAAIDFNKDKIIEAIKTSNRNKSNFIVFPELSITGYSAGDLFFQELLLDRTELALIDIANKTKNLAIISIVGAPIKVDGKIFNCAVVIQKGQILGIVPKTYLCNSKEYYEERWFSAEKNRNIDEIIIGTNNIPFGADLIFEQDNEPFASFGIEICEDLWTIKPPSFDMTINGTHLIFNLSASNEYLSKKEYRRNLIRMQSARCIGAYILSSCGPGESSTDTVFSGHCIIAENGKILSETERFNFDTQITFADIDIDRLNIERTLNNSFGGSYTDTVFRVVNFELKKLDDKKLLSNIVKNPFIPEDKNQQNEICQEILNIQTAALTKRLRHIGTNKLVIGISGGLDSTLALIAAYNTMKAYKISTKNIIGVSMPGPATSKRTKTNAKKLAEQLGITFLVIPIDTVLDVHLKQIKHSKKNDVTYENAQARERTQILMDIANSKNAIVLGTGDLSEIALGWSTYNGDHMSMYNINSGIPKTLVQYIVEWYSNIVTKKHLKMILQDILNTPISPELIKSSSKKITQKTEDIIGPYELHDFFLYYFVRVQFSVSKILLHAHLVFKKDYAIIDIKKYLKIFIKRFFSNQFKRSCIPDGVKIGTVALSPRADWRMPSDADYNLWINEIDNFKIGK